MRKWQNNNGFTLIEVIVVAAIIAILAGVLVPMIFSQIDESKITRAKGDVDSIAKALMKFKADTGVGPTYEGGLFPCSLTSATPATLYTMISSKGGLPTAADTTGGFDASYSTSFTAVLASTDPGGCYTSPTHPNPKGKWDGPYLNDQPDPWGNSYVVNSKAFDPATKGTVMVLSAGPDGIVQTNVNDTEAKGDDIIKLLR